MAMWLDGKYQVGELIGSGGMGDVYVAEQPELARMVAIKLLRPNLAADPKMRQRFKNEALVGGQLKHPNIVAVLDYGEGTDGVPYLVLEYVRGKPLSRILDAAKVLPVRRAARLMTDVLAGLAEAHFEGIIHGDVKTDNVIVDRYRDSTEVAKLLDFGLARFVSEPGLPDALVSGTPQYLAPESIRGVRPSRSSDVYGAGAMLYELLTGTTPFRSNSITEILRSHLEDDVVPPSVRCREHYIPTGIDRVVMRALAKDPDERFADAEEFRLALVAATPTEQRVVQSDVELDFACDATRMDLRPLVARQLSSSARAASVVRRMLATAIATGNISQIVGGYLELARGHVEAGALMPAVKELEEAVDVITQAGGPREPYAPEQLWRLLLPLASLYARLGDRIRAGTILDAAELHAKRHGSRTGRERAAALSALLQRAA